MIIMKRKNPGKKKAYVLIEEIELKTMLYKMKNIIIN